MREQSTTNNIFQPKHVRGGETKVMKAMKKSILTFLAFALVFTMAMPAFAANVATGATYSDVENADVADAVKVLSSLDVLKGYPDGTFKPDNTITRAEFAAVVVRLLGYEKAAQAAVGPTQFKDEVLPWASGYVNIAVQQDILTGYPDGTFRPNQNVTQAEALTILVRALGYKPLAEKQGQWPYNYIVMANYIGLTDALDGVVANQAATRAYVALASKASLTAPMAVFDGFNYNGEPTYIVSGSKADSKKITVLEKFLGYTSVEAYVVDIPRVGKLADDEVEVAIPQDDKAIDFDADFDYETYTVPEGFDFEAAFGAKVNFYVDKNDKVVFAKAEPVKYDAVEVDDVEDTLTLVDEDKDYDFAEDVIVYINGDKSTLSDLYTQDKYDFAKVGLNDKKDVHFIEAYDFEYLVVEKTDAKEKAVISYDEELDVDKYTFVKEGKTIQLADLQKDDILFFNTDAKYAEVFNNTVTGDIERVYVDLVRIDGKDYEYGDNAQYLDGDSLDSFDADAADKMKDEGAVTLFFDRAGNIVFAKGELGEVTTSSYYGYLTEELAVVKESARDNYNLYIDLVNQAAEVKSYVVKGNDIEIDAVKALYSNWDDLSSKDKVANTKAWLLSKDGANIASKGDIVKVTVDDKGKITKLAVELSTKSGSLDDATVDVTDTYFDVAGKSIRTNASAPVFLVEKYLDSDKVADIETVKLGDIKDFDQIDKTNTKVTPNVNTVVYHDGNKVIAIAAAKTNLEDDADKSLAVVTAIDEFKGSTQYRLTGFVGNKETTLYTVKDVAVSEGNLSTDGFVVAELTVSKKTGDVTGYTQLPSGQLVNTVIADKAVNTGDKTIKVGTTTYRLVSDFAVIDANKPSDVKTTYLRNVGVGYTVTLVLDKANTNYVKYVIITGK